MHIGIILDGNRRFAKKNRKDISKGHEAGAKKVEALLNWLKELEINQLTLYCFSIENFNRPKREVQLLMKLFEREFIQLEKDKRLEDEKIKVRFIGETNLLNPRLRKIIQRIEEKTKNNKRYVINFALAYSGKKEIIQAIKKTIENKEDINEKNLQNNLWLKDEPEIIIRTGNEKRLSNFLLWQSGYSELFFLDKMWPEITKQDIKEIIEEFNQRERRFGR